MGILSEEIVERDGSNNTKYMDSKLPRRCAHSHIFVGYVGWGQSKEDKGKGESCRFRSSFWVLGIGLLAGGTFPSTMMTLTTF